jgi:hypothetical protein
LKHMHCPYTLCKGRRKFGCATVREHLIKNSRDSDFRVWRGPGEADSSDEEWEQVLDEATISQMESLDPQVETERIIANAFEAGDTRPPSDERLHEAVVDAFIAADSIHTDSMAGEHWDNPYSQGGGVEEE